MSGSCNGRVARRLLFLVPFLLGALSGCSVSEAYPGDLKYPPRADRIVVDKPTEQPTTTDLPGKLDQAVARIGVPADKGGVGGEAYDPDKVDVKHRTALQTQLDKVFGKPSAPRVNSEDEELVAKLKLDRNTLRQGSVHFRRHCLHCHGLTGDGRGPTGPWLNPHPRDYRQGVFKFISTEGSGAHKPRREDLLRTLHKGIDGTSMPSFAMESDEVLETLVSYVIHLSLRGQVEYNTLATLLANKNDESKLVDESIEGHVQAKLQAFLKEWGRADKPNTPSRYPYNDENRTAREDSIRRGYKLFTNPNGAASCIACHIDFGRQVPFRYDVWGTLVRPANLTAGMYRGGRRPIDLYWRIKGGIDPSGMPGATLEAKEGDPYWDVVNFVQALPYPLMLPEDVGKKIYPAFSYASGDRASAD
jgi:mono/diheme cytochrome c family protein